MRMTTVHRIRLIITFFTAAVFITPKGGFSPPQALGPWFKTTVFQTHCLSVGEFHLLSAGGRLRMRQALKKNAAAYLKEKFELSDDRFILNWYGSAAPVGNNDAEKGRAMNRRVVGIVAGLQQ